MAQENTIGGVDSQGFAINVPYNANIPVSSIAPTTPLQIATPQYKDFSSGIANNLSYTQSVYDNQVANVDALNAQAKTQNTDLANLTAQMGGKGADSNLAMQQTGATDLAGQIRKLNAQSNALALDTQAKTLAEQNKATGQNITSQAVQRNTADATRENFINQANIAMQVAIKTADYQTAKDLADQIVNAKYDQLEADIKAKQINLQGLKDYSLTPAEKKLAEATTARLKKEEQDLADKKAQELAVSKLIIDASPVAPADVLQRAKDIQAKGGSATDVALALGQYGGDYLKNKLLDEQIKTERKQREKIGTDIQKTNQEIADLKNASNGGIPSKPLTEGQAKDLTYAQRTDQASPKIETLGKTVVSLNPVSFSTQMKLADNPLTSGQVSSEIRQYNQAVRNFITATLRRESGAQIAPSEFKDAYQVYIPFPGDDAKTLQAKKQARETAVASFKNNVPGYSARVATPEGSYVDAVEASLGKVEEKTTPISIYTSKLIGLPGVKN